MNRIIVIGIITLSAIFTACENPAANKQKATVNSAVAESNKPITGKVEKLTIAPGSSKVGFIGAKVTDSHDGGFNNFSGTIDLVDGKAENSQVSVEIDMASVTTDEADLTEHLKEPDFFDVAKFPKSTFVSTSIKAGGDKGATHTVTGNLEMHGIKRSITFPATISVTDNSVTVNSEFVINRKDFGIIYESRADNLIRDEVVLKLSVNAPRTKS
jgi:polyisoprenoid-binding protein YceI